MLHYRHQRISITINYRTLTTGTAKADDFTATNGTVNIGKDKSEVFKRYLFCNDIVPLWNIGHY